MPRKINEDQTRKEMKVPQFIGGIDLQLEMTDWYLRDQAEEQAKVTDHAT